MTTTHAVTRATAIATTARRDAAVVRAAPTARGGAVIARAAPKSSNNNNNKTRRMNTINYQPKADAPAPWWPVDERTGKPPGWFQIIVFAGSQLFIGLVMQPAAVVYQSLFDPIINK